MFGIVKSCLLGDAPFFLKKFRRNVILDFLINAIPRGIGQVCFINNTVAGFIYLLSLVLSMPTHFTILSLLGLIVATLLSMILPAFNGEIPPGVRNSASTGANGFNGFLYGAAISMSLVNADEAGNLIPKNIGYNCILVIIGAIFSVFISLWAKKFLSQFTIPVSTIPFNFTSIMVLAALHYVIDVSIPTSSSKFRFASAASSPEIFSPSWSCFPFNGHMKGEGEIEYSSHDQCFGIVMKAIFRGMGQLYFSDDWRVGLVMILSAALFSPIIALLITLGSVVGVLTGSFIDVHPAELEAGLWGFNPALTATTLGAMYFRFDTKSIVVAIIGSMFTVFMQAMLKLTLIKHNIPHFTLPYVLTSWIFYFVDWSSRIPMGEEGSPEMMSNWSFSGIICLRHTFWEHTPTRLVHDDQDIGNEQKEMSRVGGELELLSD